VIFPTDPSNNTNYKLVVELAARHRLSAIYPFQFFAR
jgi:hypothetical protein